MRLEFDTNIYPKSAIFSTFSYYSDLVTVRFSEKNSFVIAALTFNSCPTENLIDDIYKRLLQVSARHIIAEKTKIERELIIGRALYGSCLEEKE